MAELLKISVMPSCFWGSKLSHIAWQRNCPGREGKACVSEAQIFVITGDGGCSCCTLSLNQATLCLPIYNTRHHKPELILKLCAIPHTNCATTLMHGNRCPFLWAVFLCDVCCDEIMLQPWFWCETLAAVLKDNREKEAKWLQLGQLPASWQSMASFS